MTKYKKLLLKKVNIASVNHLKTLTGGTDTTLETKPEQGCISGETDVTATICCAYTEDIECKTGTTRGCSSI